MQEGGCVGKCDCESSKNKKSWESGVNSDLRREGVAGSWSSLSRGARGSWWVECPAAWWPAGGGSSPAVSSGLWGRETEGESLKLIQRYLQTRHTMGPTILSFVVILNTKVLARGWNTVSLEMLSLSRRVPYRRFHCIMSLSNQM